MNLLFRLHKSGVVRVSHHRKIRQSDGPPRPCVRRFPTTHIAIAWRVHHLRIPCRIATMVVVTSAYHVSLCWQHSGHHRASSRDHTTYFSPPSKPAPPCRKGIAPFRACMYLHNREVPPGAPSPFSFWSLRYRLVPL